MVVVDTELVVDMDVDVLVEVVLVVTVVVVVDVSVVVVPVNLHWQRSNHPPQQHPRMQYVIECASKDARQQQREA